MWSWLARRIQALQKRERFGFKYLRKKDLSRMAIDNLIVKSMLKMVQRTMIGITAAPYILELFSAARLPKQVGYVANCNILSSISDIPYRIILIIELVAVCRMLLTYTRVRLLIQILSAVAICYHGIICARPLLLLSMNTISHGFEEEEGSRDLPERRESN